MKKITMEQAVQMVKDNFDLQPFEKREDNKSFYADDKEGTHFFFDKRQYTREDVIDKMYKLFGDVVITGGWLSIEPFTLLWTQAHIMNEETAEEE